MPKQKKNHFVGRGIIQFWGNHNGQVIYWEKNDQGILEPRNPKSVHNVEYLYANWDVNGNRDMHAEEALAAEIDNEAPVQVRKILRAYPDIVPIPDSQRAFLARLVVRTVLRNPVILDRLTNAPISRFIRGLFRIKRWLNRKRLPDAAYEKLGRDRVLIGEMVSKFVTIDIEERVREFSAKRFAFLVPSNEASNFILGAQPFFMNPSMLSNTKGKERMSDAFCGVVIHPRMLVAIFDDHEEDEIIIASQEDMNRINGLFVKYSSSVVMVTPNDLEGAWYKPHGLEEGKKYII